MKRFFFIAVLGIVLLAGFSNHLVSAKFKLRIETPSAESLPFTVHSYFRQPNLIRYSAVHPYDGKLSALEAVTFDLGTDSPRFLEQALILKHPFYRATHLFSSDAEEHAAWPAFYADYSVQPDAWWELIGDARARNEIANPGQVARNIEHHFQWMVTEYVPTVAIWQDPEPRFLDFIGELRELYYYLQPEEYDSGNYHIETAYAALKYQYLDFSNRPNRIDVESRPWLAEDPRTNAASLKRLVMSQKDRQLLEATRSPTDKCYFRQLAIPDWLVFSWESDDGIHHYASRYRVDEDHCLSYSLAVKQLDGRKQVVLAAPAQHRGPASLTAKTPAYSIKARDDSVVFNAANVDQLRAQLEALLSTLFGEYRTQFRSNQTALFELSDRIDSKPLQENPGVPTEVWAFYDSARRRMFLEPGELTIFPLRLQQAYNESLADFIEFLAFPLQRISTANSDLEFDANQWKQTALKNWAFQAAEMEALIEYKWQRAVSGDKRVLIQLLHYYHKVDKPRLGMELINSLPDLEKEQRYRAVEALRHGRSWRYLQ